MPHLTPSSLGAESNHTVVVSYSSNCRRHPIHSISICSIFMISTLCGVVLFTLLLVTMALFLASVPDGSTRTRGSRGRRRNSLIDTRYMRKCLSRAGYDESLLYSLKRGTPSQARCVVEVLLHVSSRDWVAYFVNFSMYRSGVVFFGG